MDVEFFKWLGTQGIGVILAGVIFWFFRTEVLSQRERLQGLVDALLKVVGDNTASNAKLTAVIEALHREILLGREEK